MESAKKFFGEIIKTEEAKAIFASLEKPATEDEAVKTYADAAAKLGIELSAEEIKAYFAEKTASGEIDDDELVQLMGGGDNPSCSDTYQHRENCWWEDGCDFLYNVYDDYKCKRNDTGTFNLKADL